MLLILGSNTTPESFDRFSSTLRSEIPTAVSLALVESIGSNIQERVIATRAPIDEQLLDSHAKALTKILPYASQVRITKIYTDGS